MKPMNRREFMDIYRHYAAGNLSRRTFLRVTGLGAATAVLVACAPQAAAPASQPAADASAAQPAANLGDRLELTTWPNYHNLENIENFTKQTGVAVNLNVFGSNEEMLAKLQAGGSGWDVFVPTNYTIETYAKLGLIEPLDLSKIPNYDAASYEPRFLEASKAPGDSNVYAIPKNWGTTGYVINSQEITDPMATWKDFFDLTMGKYAGKTTIHDYQLTAIGNALKYFGFSFNSVDPKELAEAEKLLIASKPALFAITSDYQPPMRNGDAAIAMCWTGDALQLKRDYPAMEYVLGSEGGEIWEDNWAIAKDAPHKEAAYAFLNYMIDPAIAAKETMGHGYPQVDARASKLLTKEMLEDKIMYPAQELLTPLEFGAAITLTDPARAELWARVKSA
jgi:spermidine/putrescine transport system substrate-binding protein